MAAILSSTARKGNKMVLVKQKQRLLIKFKAIFELIYRYYILISYVQSTNEICRLMLKVYNKKVFEFISFIWRRRTRKLVRSSPYDFVQNSSQYKFNNLYLSCICWIGWLVVLLFYVHGKHLRSCRDGQLT